MTRSSECEYVQVYTGIYLSEAIVYILGLWIPRCAVELLFSTQPSFWRRTTSASGLGPADWPPNGRPLVTSHCWWSPVPIMGPRKQLIIPSPPPAHGGCLLQRRESSSILFVYYSCTHRILACFPSPRWSRYYCNHRPRNPLPERNARKAERHEGVPV